MGPWHVDIALDPPDGAGASDLAAGVGRDRVVLARGIGGHLTGWFAARAAVRGLLPADARFFGSAATLPDAWGWAGARQDAGGAAWAWSLVEPLLAAPTGDLAADLARVDGAIAALPSLPLRLHGPVASVVVLDRDGSVAQLGDVRVLVSDGGGVRDVSRPTTLASLFAAAGHGEAPPGHDGVVVRALGMGVADLPIDRLPTDPGATLVLGVRVELEATAHGTAAEHLARAPGGASGGRAVCVVRFGP